MPMKKNRLFLNYGYYNITHIAGGIQLKHAGYD